LEIVAWIYMVLIVFHEIQSRPQPLTTLIVVNSVAHRSMFRNLCECGADDHTQIELVDNHTGPVKYTI
jgi:hypothetical protein